MNKSNCSKCSKEFEKSAEDKTTLCQTCNSDMKSDIWVFQVFKWTCFSIAFLAITFFIPILSAKETSPGYYNLPGGKGRPMSISDKGLVQWKVAIPIITLSFGLIGLYLGKKEDEKKSLYRNYQNQGDELTIK